MLSDVGGGRLARVLEVQSFFLLKKIGFAPLPDIMLSQTLILLKRNLHFDVRL